MNNIKKNVLKGFTLVELIVVMAIFGLIFVAIISIANPVSKIFKNTESAEKTYAYSNNIQLYLQNTLQYADNMVVFTRDPEKGTPSLSDVAYNFVDTYYKDIITKDTTTSSVTSDAASYVNGKVYIMRLANHCSEGEIDSAGDKIKAGQIYLYTYDFNSNSSDKYLKKNADKVTAVPQLNEAYFSAGDAKYNLNYALGSQELKTVNIDGSTETYRAVSNDMQQLVPKRNEEGEIIKDGDGKVQYGDDLEDVKFYKDSITFRNLAVSVVTSKKMGNKDIEAISGVSGYTSVVDGEVTRVFNENYEIYKNPTSISVANIPLLNMISRAPSPTSNRVIMEKRYSSVPVVKTDSDGNPIKVAEMDEFNNPKKDDEGNTIYKFETKPGIDFQPGSANAFVADDIYSTIDMTNDIYIVFSYADELVEAK